MMVHARFIGERNQNQAFSVSRFAGRLALTPRHGLAATGEQEDGDLNHAAVEPRRRAVTSTVRARGRRVSWGGDGVGGELVRHPEQFGSELTQVQVASAEQSAIARMAPQVLGSVPSWRTQQGRCEKMNDELCGA